MKSKHPRLDVLQAGFGWTNELLVDGSVHVSNWQVRTTIVGRDVRFLCYETRREGLRWDCAASWTEAMSRRHRKQAKKRSLELVGVTLDPSARKVLESIRHPSQAVIEDGFQIGTAGLFWGTPGEPPPAETVVVLAETLAGMATGIETILNDSR